MLFFCMIKSNRVTNFAFLGIILLGVGALILNLRSQEASQLPFPTQTDTVACTEEAKICPDGSSVARQGPQCAFAACPYTPVSTNGWQQSAIGLPFQLQFPRDWRNTSEVMNDGALFQELYFGSEGKIVVTYGTGLGGACDESRTSVQLKNRQLIACEGIQPDGTYILSQMEAELTAADGTKQGISIAATVTAPKEANLDTILTVLSTITFN